jgi:8-amino-7-oxononanoate synthase
MTWFDAELAALGADSLLRKRRVVEPGPGAHLIVDGREMVAFCSNDYLGLQRHPALIEAAQNALAHYGVGATASPLVCGHWTPHELLEQELADFVGLPRALYFHSGYAANTGAIPALVRRGDAVFSDATNHACIIDGVRLARAESHVYPHLDLTTLEQQLRASTARRKLVVTDAVFSMDGDVAPVPELLVLCQRFDAWLMIDDAHGFGVLGAGGRGTLEHFGIDPATVSARLIYMATLGKAAGAAGAFIAGAPGLVEWLLQRARTYMFATATPPATAEALRASLRVIDRERWRREHLAALRAQLVESLRGLPWRLLPSDTAIQPLIIGDNAETMRLMSELWARGVWAPGIRPPTVPVGTARLRISLCSAHTTDDVRQLTDALQQAARAHPPE